MRVRLLIDVVLDADKVPELAQQIIEQPATSIVIEGDHNGALGGRLVGAQPVEVSDE